MNPFQFGEDPSQPLVGQYHAPRASVAKKSAVLLCSPIAQEYMRTHWALRQLANLLTDSGFHVMRFDYYGCGDSFGEEGEGRIPTWIQNISQATQELREISGTDHVTFIGLRFGASLALKATSKLPLNIRHLILWDPVIRGSDYLNLLEQFDAEMAKDRIVPPQKSNFLLGFSFPEELRTQIQSMDLLQSATPINLPNVSLITSENRSEYLSLKEILSQGLGQRLNSQMIDEPGMWNSLSEAHHALLSAKIIQTIAQATEKFA